MTSAAMPFDRQAVLFEAAKEIPRKLTLDLANGVTAAKLQAALSDLTDQATFDAINPDPRGRRRQVASAWKAFSTYMALTKELRDQEMLAPLLPEAFQTDVTRWFQDTQARMDFLGNRQSRSGKKHAFYVHVIGLFNMAFDTKPTVWVETDNEDSHSPLVAFAAELIRLGGQLVDDTALGIKGNGGRNAIRQLWEPSSPSAIKMGLRTALAQEQIVLKGTLENPQEHVVTAWKVQANYYASLMDLRTRLRFD